MDNRILRYKYLPFNEGSLCVISEGTMKFTASADFNDPFDCIPVYDSENMREHLKGRKDLLKKAGALNGLSPAKRIQSKNKMLAKIERAVESGEYAEGLVQKLGVCSLSRSFKSLLMWAHYAKDHKGFVVEFSIPEVIYGTEEEANKSVVNYLYPFPVTYQEERPVINLKDSKYVNSEKNFLVKGTDWEYEQEERCLDLERKPGIHPYDRKEILSSVIAGSKMCAEDFTRLKKVVGHASSELGRVIPIYKAGISKDRYEVIVSGREV